MKHVNGEAKAKGQPGVTELSDRHKKYLSKHHAQYLQAQTELNSAFAQVQLMQQKVRGQVAALRDFATDVVAGADTPHFPAVIDGKLVVLDHETGKKHGLEDHLFVEPKAQQPAPAPPAQPTEETEALPS